MLEHPKMRESILVAPRIPNCSRHLRLALLSQKTRRAYCEQRVSQKTRAYFEQRVDLKKYTHVRTYTKIKRKAAVWRALRGGPCPRLCAAAAPGCAPRPLHYYSHSRGAPTRALVGGRPIASPRNVLGHGQRLSRLAAAAGPPLHRLTLNSTHRTQSQNTAPDATHGHGLLRLGHRHLA